MKTIIFRFRISPELKEQFEEASKRLDQKIQPGKRLQMLMWDFVNQNRVESLVDVKIWRPDGYDYGVYMVKAVLTEDGRELSEKRRIVFDIPTLPKRRIYGEKDFMVAGFKNQEGANPGSLANSKNNIVLRGEFHQGEWEGHVYSNGISEDENPTPIESVKGALITEIQKPLLQ